MTPYEAPSERLLVNTPRAFVCRGTGQHRQYRVFERADTAYTPAGYECAVCRAPAVEEVWPGLAASEYDAHMEHLTPSGKHLPETCPACMAHEVCPVGGVGCAGRWVKGGTGWFCELHTRELRRKPPAVEVPARILNNMAYLCPSGSRTCQTLWSAAEGIPVCERHNATLIATGRETPLAYMSEYRCPIGEQACAGRWLVFGTFPQCREHRRGLARIEPTRNQLIRVNVPSIASGDIAEVLDNAGATANPDTLLDSFTGSYGESENGPVRVLYHWTDETDPDSDPDSDIVRLVAKPSRRFTCTEGHSSRLAVEITRTIGNAGVVLYACARTDCRCPVRLGQPELMESAEITRVVDEIENPNAISAAERLGRAIMAAGDQPASSDTLGSTLWGDGAASDAIKAGGFGVAIKAALGGEYTPGGNYSYLKNAGIELPPGAQVEGVHVGIDWGDNLGCVIGGVRCRDQWQLSASWGPGPVCIAHNTRLIATSALDNLGGPVVPPAPAEPEIHPQPITGNDAVDHPDWVLGCPVDMACGCREYWYGSSLWLQKCRRHNVDLRMQPPPEPTPEPEKWAGYFCPAGNEGCREAWGITPAHDMKPLCTYHDELLLKPNPDRDWLTLDIPGGGSQGAGHLYIAPIAHLLDDGHKAVALAMMDRPCGHPDHDRYPPHPADWCGLPVPMTLADRARASAAERAKTRKSGGIASVRVIYKCGCRLTTDYAAGLIALPSLCQLHDERIERIEAE